MQSDYRSASQAHVKSQTVQNILPLTQAEYDDLAQESAIDPNTFYLIKSASQ